MSSNKSHSSKTTTTTSTPESEESKLVQKLKVIFPVFKSISDSDKNLIELARLVDEISNETYEPNKKYRLMYKVIKIGVLAGNIKPLNIESAADTLKNSSTQAIVKVASLKDEEQMAVLKLCRNIGANFLNIMYEDKIKQFLTDVTDLHKGVFNKNSVLKTHTDCTKVVSGKNIGVFLKTNNPDKAKLKKLYCQIIYFLEKAKQLANNKDFDGSKMALIAAGCCARNLLSSGILTPSIISKPKPIIRPPSSILPQLIELRKLMAHEDSGKLEEGKILEQLKIITTEDAINAYINNVISDATSEIIKITLEDIKIYNTIKSSTTTTTTISSPTTPSIATDVESPRAFEKSVFKP